MDEWKLYRLVTWFPSQVTRPITLFVQRQPEAGAVFLDWCLRSRQKWEVVFGDMCPHRHMVPWWLNGLAYRLTCVSVPRRAKMWQAVQGHNMEPSWEKFGTLCVQLSTPIGPIVPVSKRGWPKRGWPKRKSFLHVVISKKFFTPNILLLQAKKALLLIFGCYKPREHFYN